MNLRKENLRKFEVVVSLAIVGIDSVFLLLAAALFSFKTPPFPRLSGVKHEPIFVENCCSHV